MATRIPILKGSEGHIYHFLLHDILPHGRCTLSYDAIADLTGYTPTTVKQAIKRLVTRKIIAVEKEYGDRRNSYVLGQP